MNVGFLATRWRRLVVVLAGVLCAPGAVGCSHTCADTYMCYSSDFEVSCPDDPAEAPAADVPAECGVWVSASLGDDANDGSPRAPVATLAQAAAKAVHRRRRVYACAETFDEVVTWPAAVGLHGGFDCTDLDWRYVGNPTLTEVAAPAGEIPLTLAGSSDSELSLLTDLKIVAATAIQPGGSSIAVMALSDARVEIRRSSLQSGNGADGADGDDGDHFGNPAKGGLHGENGAAACTASTGLGGELVALDCDEDASFGGRGGNGGEMAATPGDDGEVAPASNPQGLGLGGHAEDLVTGLLCTPGFGGANGKDGDPGLGGLWPPRLTAAGYLGVWGGDGTRGRAGQGGGGGGASAASSAACGAPKLGGAGGGSGGSGGCGGKGGRGGQPGGASIGLATLTSEIVLVDVSIQTGNGGRGGAGGVPQQGGWGGLPGIGGAGTPGGPNPGCGGGIGGYGGDGGPAGGGLGGPALAVAYTGTLGPDASGVTIILGEAGKGGLGSDPDLVSAWGEKGIRAERQALLP